ncbi:ABC transporter ATP-binding protein [Desulfofundulus thermosubterraneus]|uniref:Branched-chain amino acid transport system ATP-binding protein n=1 Tax=Desulfofundulus thermosubterraneus DSM 16057 TaxID=1121432 RepID=A0A1M6H8K8_9FIRM|nr:ABC transporter ATP-binding protein [Desulfofundulus thermosubterraneus]SHJ18561.1 branched-chain amino acid transport system ATP-binding protein [Desulfofundulus thermosubterraneus DSM 16057]
MSDEAILRLDSITMKFGGLTALENVSFEVRAGEICGLIGPNGAGKTTLFNVVCGVYRPAGGTVWFKGEPVSGLPVHQIARRGIARTFQVVKPIPRLTVLENVMIAAASPLLAGSWVPFTTRGQREVRQKAMDALARVGLVEEAHLPAGQLNLGYLRRLELARALVMNPSLLLLDEPVAGLGYDAVEDFLALVKELRRDGLTVLLVEHNTGVAEALCDHMVVLDHGKMIAAGDPARVLADPAVVEAYLGKDDSLGPSA